MKRFALVFLLALSSLLFAKKNDEEKSKPLKEKTKIQKMKDEAQELEIQQKLDALKFEQSIFDKKQEIQIIDLEKTLKEKLKEKNLSEEERKIREQMEKMDLELKAATQKRQAEALKHQKEIQAFKQELEKANLENELQSEAYRAKHLFIQNEELKLKELRNDIQTDQLKLQAEVERLQTQLTLRSREQEWDLQTNQKIKYEENPYKEGVLHISDRRIELDGPIVYGVADYVTERIHYFNNKSSKYPIFIVIERCPGGSVMEGYRILKAMEGSRAPIHVVVKSYAASMAAVITTLAEHSYIYENAIILHHQMSGLAYGNLASQRKRLERLEEWSIRLFTPVATKLGYTLEELYVEMYKNDPNGDWLEFGSAAKKINWVDNVVQQVQEHGLIENPDSEQFQKKKASRKNGLAWSGVFSEEQEDKKMQLPKLDVFDAYFLYNGDEHYIW